MVSLDSLLLWLISEEHWSYCEFNYLFFFFKYYFKTLAKIIKSVLACTNDLCANLFEILTTNKILGLYKIVRTEAPTRQDRIGGCRRHILL